MISNEITKKFKQLQKVKTDKNGKELPQETLDPAAIEIYSRVLKNIQTIQKAAIGEVKSDVETGNFKKVMSKLTAEIFKDE